MLTRKKTIKSRDYKEYLEEININEQKKKKKKKTLTPEKGVRKQNNKNNKKKKKKKHNLKYDTNTNANCLASLHKWDPLN